MVHVFYGYVLSASLRFPHQLGTEEQIVLSHLRFSSNGEHRFSHTHAKSHAVDCSLAKPGMLSCFIRLTLLFHSSLQVKVQFELIAEPFVPAKFGR